jgi:hypothetical protein
MSHHFDSPTAIEDGRLNLTDVYAFSGQGNTTNLILNVNPDAGRSWSTSLRPDALYEFAVASDAGTVEDRALRMTFDEPDAEGRQRMTVRLAVGEQSLRGIEGELLGSGITGELFPLAGGGSAWFGVVGDPFWGDGVALAGFLGRIAAGEYHPDVFGARPSNIFEGRNVTAIALQVPNTLFGGERVALWARISLYGHAAQRQVSRMGNPMLRPLFFGAPGPDSETLNAGSPGDDVQLYTERIRQVATAVAELRRLDDPSGHAAAVAKAFLPDVLYLRPGKPARYEPGAGNGRGLRDDAFGIALSLVHRSPLGLTTSPHPAIPDFPHLPPVDRQDRPALMDLFGLRRQPSSTMPEEAIG